MEQISHSLTGLADTQRAIVINLVLLLGTTGFGIIMFAMDGLLFFSVEFPVMEVKQNSFYDLTSRIKYFTVWIFKVSEPRYLNKG